MNHNKALFNYILSIADNNLILGQRLGELCGHGINLETDIALTNMALDLIGQVRNYYQYAIQHTTDFTNEDELAFLRPERQYYNTLLVEQPNKDFAYTIVRQVLYDYFHFYLLENLSQSKDEILNAIAQKGIKEVGYHKTFSSSWMLRLGDGTDTSHQKIQQALTDLWPYTHELFEHSSDEKELIKQGIAVNTLDFKSNYFNDLKELAQKATLKIPESTYFKSGGKVGKHSENMGYLLAEMQFMQRAYPNNNW